MKGRLLVALALWAGAALAQDACPHSSEVRQADMLGLWRAELEGVGHFGTLLLEKHALYSESFSGTVNRDGERRQLAGDVEDGEVTLEESADGVRIAANWVGELVEGSCGREIRGVWTVDGEQAGKPFVLRKIPVTPVTPVIPAEAGIQGIARPSNTGSTGFLPARE